MDLAGQDPFLYEITLRLTIENIRGYSCQFVAKQLQNKVQKNETLETFKKFFETIPEVITD